MDLDHLLIELGQHQGSDLHLKVGRPPLFRVRGELTAQSNYPEVSAEDMREIVYRLLGQERARIFEQELEADFSYEIPNYARYRVNAFVQRGQIGAVMRLVPLEVPTVEKLGLPAVMKELCDSANGLILVTGPTGSGKSTSLAAMIEYVNQTYPLHIVTIEDPIEFVYTDALSAIDQRELGLDTHELNRALRASLRQDPDVILMGEMRDPETIRFAITAAETGHLVLSTLHTNDAKQSLDRIMGAFEGAEANQVRMQLALTLRGILSQRLLKRADGQGRVPAIEILINTAHMRELIEAGNTRDLDKAIAEGVHHKMQTFNMSLYDLWKRRMISEEEALANSTTPDDLRLMMRGIRRGAGADEANAAPSPAAGQAPPPAIGKRTPAATFSGVEKKVPGRGF